MGHPDEHAACAITGIVLPLDHPRSRCWVLLRTEDRGRVHVHDGSSAQARVRQQTASSCQRRLDHPRMNADTSLKRATRMHSDHPRTRGLHNAGSFSRSSSHGPSRSRGLHASVRMSTSPHATCGPSTHARPSLNRRSASQQRRTIRARADCTAVGCRTSRRLPDHPHTAGCTRQRLRSTVWVTDHAGCSPSTSGAWFAPPEHPRARGSDEPPDRPPACTTSEHPRARGPLRRSTNRQDPHLAIRARAACSSSLTK